MRRTLTAFLSLNIACASSLSSAETLPRPEALQDAVEFWQRVYSEIDTSQGFIHDNRHLDIVYETLSFPEKTSYRNRDRQIRAVKEKYERILATLAGGKREGLSGDEKRVLALWGGKGNASEFRQASQRLRFQLGQRNKFVEGIQRSGAWEGYIHQVLSASGVPAELAALPHVESSFDPGARSHVGAAGLWQFMRSTGLRYLTIDHIQDERLDPYRSTEAAALLLAQNYEVTGTWPLAITAYNHGASGMRRAAKSMGTKDIDVIVERYRSRTFGFASRNFYTAFLAAVDVSQDAEHYFGPVRRDPPDASLVGTLNGYFPVSELTTRFAVDTTTLRRLNPSLTTLVWSGEKHVPKGFRLRLPPELGQDAVVTLAGLSGFPSQTPDLFHVVSRGET